MSLRLHIFWLYFELAICEDFMNIDVRRFFSIDVKMADHGVSLLWFRTGLEKHTKVNRFGRWRFHAS